LDNIQSLQVVSSRIGCERNANKALGKGAGAEFDEVTHEGMFLVFQTLLYVNQ